MATKNSTFIQPTLSDVEKLTKDAGKILMNLFGSQFEIEYKSSIDPVTEADRRAEEYILETIKSQYPGHAILAEESGENAGDCDCRWYIDPLDGTVNFAHGIPIFCVSIAYEYKGQLKLAAVYDPTRDECFSAEANVGSFINNEPIHVSNAQTLAESLLVTGFPYDAWSNPQDNSAQFKAMMKQTQGVRRLGSAALDLCYVAAGRFDGFWELELKQWDLAAGALIVTEAGGIVTDMNGNNYNAVDSRSVAAANSFIHADMLSELNEVA